MRRMFTALAALLLALGWLFAVAAPARADDDHPDWRITKYDVVTTVDGGGTANVQLTIDFDFANDPGHGPYLYLPQQQAIAGDPDHWRMIDYTLGTVTSPSGANATVVTSESDGNLVIRIGQEGQTFTGVQSYQLTYTAHGLIAPKQAQSGLDEFNWNAVGQGWEVPIEAATVKVTGPVAITQVACFTIRDYENTSTCEAAQDGASATFSATSLGNGEGMQVVAGFPGGTFVGAEPRYTTRLTLGNMFPVTPWTGTAAAALSVLGLGWLVRRTRRSNRDEVYLGLTPGVTPARGQEAAVGRDSSNAPVAVQFTPPRDARPGEIGTLMDATADDRDITATLVDLAVRGHLKIAQPGKHDFEFTRLAGGDQLAGYESGLLDRLFRSSERVTTEDLKDESYASLLSATRGDLYSRVTTELHWFTRNPMFVRVLAIAGGVGLVAAGVVGGLLLGLVGWGLVGVAGLITGIGVLIMNNKFGSRSADGSAVLAQAKGFELYLTTAEADQIKFEEGIDVFSRYLPYAMVFGVAERWTKVFQQLAAQGAYTFPTYWYVGYYPGGFGMGELGSSMNALTSSISSSLQAATAASSASSGGSGFSGGGGFGGGGGGGW
ncbi:MAG: DUF2207 domain-containing protein [Propionibacteriaceae bacterium]|nr:DUF2207 domain-containing protein [Propionibacteriaceae bacterium]